MTDDLFVTWTRLCGVDQLSTEQGVYVETQGRNYAVWLIGQSGESSDHGSVKIASAAVRVMDDRCPHAGGSMSAGRLEDECVICPWHGWPFDYNSGACPDNQEYRVTVYPVRIVDGHVEADLG
jgi:nitrite reductase/ring-hydroxylating ferredoxin subunit